MDRAGVQAWVALYERAWRTPGTEVLAELFAPEATYQTAPFEEPFQGLPAIAAMWEAEREGPEEVFAMDSEVVAVEGDTGVARLEVRYGDPVRQTYRDLWVVRFDAQGRCRPCRHHRADGGPAGATWNVAGHSPPGPYHRASGIGVTSGQLDEPLGRRCPRAKGVSPHPRQLSYPDHAHSLRRRRPRPGPTPRSGRGRSRPRALTARPRGGRTRGRRRRSARPRSRSAADPRCG